MAKLRVNAATAKEAERKRLLANREVKLRNRLRGEEYQVISNPIKLAKMTSKARKGLRRMPEGVGGTHRKLKG